MSIRLYDPVGEVGPISTVAPSRLDALQAGRVGYVFNHHPAAEAVWQSLEANIGKLLNPRALARIDKDNVAISVPRPDLERLARETDYVLVGVGA
jgi:hypothetical protein